MTDEQEFTKGGSPIYHYDDEKPFEAVKGEECLEEISDHINKHLGEIDWVFHELVSDTVHIDVHFLKANKNRPYHILVTSGMSDLPMTLPEGIEANRYMELMVFLPETWKISEEDFKENNWYWPIENLKFLARFPHKYDSWLSFGHTMPNGNPPDYFADNTKLNGVIILPPISVPDEFRSLKINDDKEIHFYSYVPLYQEEMDLKLNKGTDELLDRFDKNSIADIVDIKRKNVAKKFLGIF